MAKVAEFLIEEDDGSMYVTDEVDIQPKVVVHQQEPIIVTPTTRIARIKGTWLMQWGPDKFNFVDGRRYEIPLDLFEYLKRRGNIYDTL